MACARSLFRHIGSPLYSKSNVCFRSTPVRLYAKKGLLEPLVTPTFREPRKPDHRPRKPGEDLVVAPGSNPKDAEYIFKSVEEKRAAQERTWILKKQREAGLVPDPMPFDAVGVLQVDGKLPMRLRSDPSLLRTRGTPHFEPPVIVMRVNDTIMADSVRVIDENGKSLGIKTYDEAMDLADAADKDLVEWVSTSNPPVCKLMDYKAYLTAERDKAYKNYLASLAPSTSAETEWEEPEKSVTINHTISEHDLQIKVGRMEDWLQRGYKVKVALNFKSPDDFDVELGNDIIQNVFDRVADHASGMSTVSKSVQQMSVYIAPKKPKEKKLGKKEKRELKWLNKEKQAKEEDSGESAQSKVAEGKSQAKQTAAVKGTKTAAPVKEVPEEEDIEEEEIDEEQLQEMLKESARPYAITDRAFPRKAK
eukprot:TRINITY_DN31840_c0_g1_i2.p1 TRINITY_DN31840_c0_g1~~TRINITY_DN31840_c0_g1_i2.p1  ORF type:complete len:421 (+),score=74.14 TRINITY_DN31840_c0_g1_i2:118-1380(+)